MAEFAENVRLVNALAERMDGFVWRLHDETGHAMNMVVYEDDPSIMPNLSVWRDIESLRAFVFRTVHRHFFARRDEWFEPLSITNTMWWIDEHERPTMQEGRRRRDLLLMRGPSEDAFGWEQLTALAGRDK